MRRPSLLLLGLALPLAPAIAQEPSPSTIPAQVQATTPTPGPGLAPVDTQLDPAHAADAKAIADLVAAFEKAFAAADSGAIGATFTEDARVADDEGMTVGRQAIEARFAAFFEGTPKGTLANKVESLRFVSPDVAMEEGRVTLTAPNLTETNKYSVVYVKQGGKWLQSSLRDFSADEPGVPDRLKDLEWLVGEWVNESQEAVVRTTCTWSEDKHYLLRDFVVSIEGKPQIKGTQRIGWDPERKQIRSWVFDSVGGFSEGYWTRVGEQWMIKAHGVHHDGKPVSATQVITRLGRDHLRWTAFDRTRGGDLVPETDEYSMVRRGPAPATISAPGR